MLSNAQHTKATATKHSMNACRARAAVQHHIRCGSGEGGRGGGSSSLDESVSYSMTVVSDSLPFPHRVVVVVASADVACCRSCEIVCF